ncbi:hypothetical protein LguiB_003092 [Lonicera macranthoides]
MEGRYGMYSQGSSGWTTLRNEEFQEDDIWSVLRETNKDSNSNSISKSKKSSVFASRGLPSASKMIPRSSKIPNKEPKIVHQSAPVNIPDWSKIYGKHSMINSSKKASRFDDGDGHGVMRVGLDSDEDDDDDDDEDEDGDGDGNMMPPHEWIAKRHARSQKTSFSVFEGVGRTLKGRDLSRVRNAILTRTGFLE